MPPIDIPSRQTPSSGEIFLDHVGWYVPDLGVAGTAFERLGFRLTPYTAHTDEQPDGSRAPSGTANRCAMVELGYLEILSAVDGIETEMAQRLRRGLDRYQGLHLIAFTCADASDEHARLAADGFAPQPTVALRRSMTLDDGSEGTAAFSVIRLPPDAMEEGRVQLLSQDTPEVVWQPSLIARDNAIDALAGIVVCSADPAASAARFARFVARRVVERGRRYEIPLDRGTILVCDDREFQEIVPGAAVPSLPFIGAVVMRSRDLAASRSFLKDRGVTLTFDGDEALCIDAIDAMGAYLVIHDGKAAWPAV